MIIGALISLGIGIAVGTIIRNLDNVYDHGLGCLDKAKEILEEETTKSTEKLDAIDGENNAAAIKALCIILKIFLITTPRALYFTVIGLAEGVVWLVLSLPKMLVIDPLANLMWR